MPEVDPYSPEAMRLAEATLDAALSARGNPQPAAAPMEDQRFRGDWKLTAEKYLDDQLSAKEPGWLGATKNAFLGGAVNVGEQFALAGTLAGQPGAVGVLAAAEKYKKSLPEVPSVKQFSQITDTWKNEPWYQRWVNNVVAAVIDPSISVPSVAGALPGMATIIPATIAGGAVGGPVGAAGGMGLAAGAQGAAEAFMESFREQGVDTSDPIALYRAIGDKSIITKAAIAAGKRGLTDAAFGALSAGVLGKLGGVIGRMGIPSDLAEGAAKVVADAGAQGVIGAGQQAADELVAGRTPTEEGAAQAFIGGAAMGPIMAAGARLGGKPPPPDAMGLLRWVAANKIKAESLVASGPTRSAFEDAGLPRWGASDRTKAHEAVKIILAKANEPPPPAGEAPGAASGEESTPPASGIPPVEAPGTPKPTPGAIPPPAEDATTPPEGFTADESTGTTEVAGPSPDRSIPAVERMWAKDDPADWTPKALAKTAGEIMDAKPDGSITQKEALALAHTARTPEVSLEIRRQAKALLDQSDWAAEFDIPEPTGKEVSDGKVQEETPQAQVLKPSDGQEPAPNEQGTPVSKAEPATGGAETPSKQPWQMTKKEFAKSGFWQHSVLRDGAGEIGPEGFKSGIGPNVVPATEGPPTDVMAKQYGTRAGVAVIPVPKDATIETPNGRKIRDGWSPHPDSVVTPRYDHQPLHEAIVEQAIGRGERVSDRVLADYPGLKNAPAEPVTKKGVKIKVIRKPRKAQPGGPFTKDDIERQILSKYDSMDVHAGDTAKLEEAGISRPFTFARELPPEVRDYVEQNPRLKSLFQVENPTLGRETKADGLDAFYLLGSDAYFKMAEDTHSGGEGPMARLQRAHRVNLAKDALRGSPDPEANFLAQLHDNLPRGRQPAKNIVEPTEANIPTGSTFEINGSKFRVTPDKDGFRMLRDGEDFTPVPIDALEKVPIDRGTLKKGKPPRDGGGGTPVEIPAQKDMFGIKQPGWVSPGTGRQQSLGINVGDLLTGKTEGSTGKTFKPSRDATDQSIADRYNESDTPMLPGREGEAKPPSEPTDLPETPDDGIPFRKRVDDQARTSGGAKFARPTPGAAPKESISAPKIVRWASDTFDVPITYGKVTHPDAMGVYDKRQEVVRLRGEEAANLETAVHEVAHDIDKVNGIVRTMPQAIRRELAQLDYDYPKQRRASEGFAEYIAAKAHGNDPSGNWVDITGRRLPPLPKFDAWWKNYLAKDPELAGKLDSLAEKIKAFESQGAEGRVLAHISQDRQAQTPDDRAALEQFQAKINEKGSLLRTTFVDTAHPIATLDTEVSAVMKKIGAAESFKALGIKEQDRIPTLWLAHRAITSGQKDGLSALQSGAFLPKDPLRKQIAPSMPEFYKAIKGVDSKIVSGFALSKQAIAAHKRGIETGFRDEDARAFVAKYEKDPRVVRGFEILHQMNEALLDVSVDAGMIDASEAAAMRKAWGDSYIPMFRVRDYEPSLQGKMQGQTIKPFARRYGSGHEIVDPIISTAIKYEKVYRDAALSLVNHSVVETSRLPGMGWLVRRDPTPTKTTKFSPDEIHEQLVAAGMDPKAFDTVDPDAVMRIFRPDAFAERDPNTIRVKENGQWRNFHVEPNIAMATQALLHAAPSGYIGKVFSVLNGFVRNLATTNNPAWAIGSNLWRDPMSYVMQGRGNIAQRVSAIPAEWIRAIGRKVGGIDDPIYALYERSRGDAALADAGKPVTLRQIERAAGVEKFGPEMILHHVGEAIRMPGQFIESMPRVAAFRRALIDGGFTAKDMASGKIPSRKLVYQALREADEITTNFAMHGRRDILKALMFGNATVQGSDRMVRAFTNPETRNQTIGRVIGLTALAAAKWWYEKDLDAHKEADAWTSRYMTLYDAKGRPYLRIPYAQDWGMIPGMVGAGLDAAYRGTSAPIWKTLLTQLGAFTASPAGVMPLIEDYANKDTWGRPIETQHMQGLLAKDRVNPSTAETSKLIANRVLMNYWGASPVRVEHMLDSYTAGVYRNIVRPLEHLFIKETAQLQMRDIPVLGRMAYSNDAGHSEGDFYKNFDKQRQAVGSLKLRGTKEGPEIQQFKKMEKYKELIQEMRATIREERDRAARFEVEKYITGIARRALSESGVPDSEPLKDYPDPLTNRPDNPDVLKAVAKVTTTELLKATNPHPKRQNGQSLDKYNEIVASWEQDKAQAEEFLKGTFYTDDELRQLLVDKVRGTGRIATTFSGKGPTALGKREARVGALK